MNFGTTEKGNKLRNLYIFFPLILFAGLILRIIFSTFITYKYDFQIWMNWGQQISDVGFSNFYDRYWCDYMPGYLYVLWILDNLHKTFHWIPVDILFKLPANFADFGISILIFFALRGITTLKNAMIASVVYLFNPASLSNSTFWGQVDSFHALPILFSVLMGLRQRFILSGVFAALAFMIKPQSIVVFPVIGFLAIRPIIGTNKKFALKPFLPSILLVAAIILTSSILTIPFIWDDIDSLSYMLTGPVDLVRERFETAYGQYNSASLNAFNFWGAVAMWQSDEITFLWLSYRTWGTLIFFTLYALIMGLLFRFALVKREEDGSVFEYVIFEAITLILFSLFLFVTRAHERHLLPAIVFFTIIAYKSWILWYLYGVLSFVYVVNMTYAYVQLTTGYQGIPESYYYLFMPGMFLLSMVVFVALLVHFIKDAFKYKIPHNSISSHH